MFAKLTTDAALGRIALLVVLLMFFGFQIQVGLPTFLKLPSQPFSIVFRLIYLSMALYLILIVLARRKHYLWNFGIFCILAFWLFYAGRVVYDIGFLSLNELAQPRQSKFYYFTWIFGSGLIPVLGIVFTAKYINLKRDAWLIYLFSGLQIAVSVFLFVTTFDSITESMLRFRVSIANEEGNILNPITMGRFGTIAILLGIGNLLLNKKLRYNRLLSWMLILSGLFFIVMGGSRGPILAFSTGLLALLYFHFSQQRKTVLFLLKWGIGIFLFILAIAIFLVPRINPEDFAALSRMAELTEGNEKEERNISWTNAWNQFLESPVLGDQMFERYWWQYPHNVILESFMATGLVGGIIFCCFFFYCLYKIYSFKGYPLYYTTLGMIGLVTLVSSMFSGGLYFNSEFWSMTALLVGIKPKFD